MRTTMAPGAGSSMRAGAPSLGERGPAGPRAGSRRVSSRRPAPGSPAARGCRSGGGSGGGDSGLSCLLPAGLRGMLRAARRGGRHRHRGLRSQPARGPCGVRKGGECGCRDRGGLRLGPRRGPRLGASPGRGPAEDTAPTHTLLTGIPAGTRGTACTHPPQLGMDPRDDGGERVPAEDPPSTRQPGGVPQQRTPALHPGHLHRPLTSPHRHPHLWALTQEPTTHAGISQRHPTEFHRTGTL